METGLLSLFWLIIALIIIIISTSILKINAFIVLLIGAYIYARLTGIDSIEAIGLIKQGFGDLIDNVGLIYLFGTILGTLMDKTGNTSAIAIGILKRIGYKRKNLVALLGGFTVAIPINCDPGFITLFPIINKMGYISNVSTYGLEISLAGGLLLSHTLVPPTAGPTTVASILGADIGKVIILGIIVGILTIFVSNIYIDRFVREKDIIKKTNDLDIEINNIRGIDFFKALLPIVFPIVTICLGGFSRLEAGNMKNRRIYELLQVLGDPVIALFLANVLVIVFMNKKSFKYSLDSWITEALHNAATIVFITAAGSAFAQVIKASPVIGYLSKNITYWNIGLLAPFIVAAILKTAQGSSTVAMITTAGVFSPLIGEMNLNPVMCTLVIGAGSMIVSHTNDSYFWVIVQATNLPVKYVLKKYSVFTLCLGLMAFIIIFAINFVIF